MKNLLISMVLLASAIFLSGCLNFGSDTSRDVNVIASLTSPNQSYVATSFSSSGGGAAGWCYVQVNVRKQTEQFNPDNGVVFVTRCNVKPDVEWESERKLRIGYPADSTVYTQEKPGAVAKAWKYPMCRSSAFFSAAPKQNLAAGAVSRRLGRSPSLVPSLLAKLE